MILQCYSIINSNEVILLEVQTKITTHIKAGSILLVIVLISWIVTMIMLSPSGTIQDQLRQTVADWQLFQISFGIALAIAPAFLYLLITLTRYTTNQLDTWQIAGLTLAGFYLLCATVSYGSQLILLPYYLRQEMYSIAEIWFFLNENSIPYFVNQTGYALWACSVLLLFGRLVKEKGIWRWLGGLFILSGLLSIIAYAGLLLSVPMLNQLTLASGVLTLPIAILAFVAGHRRVTLAGDDRKEELE